MNPKYEYEVEITYNVLSIVLGIQASNINQRKSEHRSVREKGNIKMIYKVILNVVRQTCYKKREQQTWWGRGGNTA